ncbi:MAG TPA: PIG-L family deacetylase [Chitinophagales bacterium]|nr:PIG-L family deacetylase [Chitinophagales bacterium]
MKSLPLYRVFALPLLLILFNTTQAQTHTGPKVLVVVAHPDDETAMAATIYKITHDLNGTVDQCVITNGEGGYKYSTLAEAYYGLELTDEAVGRENLPRIRKQELMNAGKIIGTHNIFFLDQKDAHYGLNEHEPLDTTWDVAWISRRLNAILTATHYDFIFCLLPVPETHAHHKAATLLALRAVQTLPENERPVILGCSVSSKTDTAKTQFTQLKNYTETKVEGTGPMFQFDRSVKFGYHDVLSYQIIVNWEIAEHKSQGTMQLAMQRGDYEDYWYFALNNEAGKKKCAELFEQLKKIPYKPKTY